MEENILNHFLGGRAVLYLPHSVARHIFWVRRAESITYPEQSRNWGGTRRNEENYYANKRKNVSGMI